MLVTGAWHRSRSAVLREPHERQEELVARVESYRFDIKLAREVQQTHAMLIFEIGARLEERDCCPEFFSESAHPAYVPMLLRQIVRH